MVGRIVKWSAIALGVLLLVVAGTAVFAYARAEVKLRRSMALDVSEETGIIVAATREGAAERGRRIAVYRGCVSCHGADLGGKVVLDDPGFGRLVSTNLTSGRGGIAETYRAEDWVRAIRHGVGPAGEPLVFMPSHEYFPLGERDMADLLAHLQNVEPVDRTLDPTRLGPLAYVFVGLGLLPLPVDQIEDHSGTRRAPAVGPTAEYGAYLAITCMGCHGEDLAGGSIPGATIPAANLTPHADGLAAWSRDEFHTALRSGTLPTGGRMDDEMPWELYSVLRDDELDALWTYLATVPPRPGN